MLGICGLYFTFSLAKLSVQQNNILDRQMRREEAEAKAREEERATKMRHIAASVHKSAADAFGFAQQAHFEAVRTNYRAAAELSQISMERVADARNRSLLEPATDDKKPPLSAFLHEALSYEALVMWQASILYYAASTVLHVLDEEVITLLGEPPEPKERREQVLKGVRDATRWLGDALILTSHIDDVDLQRWAPDLRRRIMLRQADARSFEHAVFGDVKAATQVYEAEEAKFLIGNGATGAEHLVARLLSNHAMALFGLGTAAGDAKAVKRLKRADVLIMSTKRRAVDGRSSAGAEMAERTATAEDDTSATPVVTASMMTFDKALQSYERCTAEDRRRILLRKRVSVPTMLLFVASLSGSEDLVGLLDTVVGRTRAFMRSDKPGMPNDEAWLKCRGMVRVLVSVFAALEHCPTDDESATNQLADEVIRVAAELATIREWPDKAARGGDFGAFACVVAQNRPAPWSLFGSAERRPVAFSELARAKRMEREAIALYPKRPTPRRTGGTRLDAGRREAVRDLLEAAKKMA